MSETPVKTRIAPHMEHFVKITPYRTSDNPDAMQLRLQIGVQSFLISDGADNCHEGAEAAEWHRNMLCIALATLRNEVIEECAKAADKWGRGEWRVQEQKRVRFSLQDLQTHTNIAGRGIAEDIRALHSPEASL